MSSSPPSSSSSFPPSLELRSVDLFGGAIETKFPAASSFEDISRLRDVPDNQEVFLDTASNISLAIELFSMETEKEDEELLTHYFEDINVCNQAILSAVLAKVVTIHFLFLFFFFIIIMLLANALAALFFPASSHLSRG